MEENDHHLCILCREIFTSLDSYVNHRKSGCKPNQEDYFSNAPAAHKAPNSHQPHHSQAFESLENVVMGFPTATHALASEAAFMENIGLYPALPIATTKQTKEPTISDQNETNQRSEECPDDLLMWNDTSKNKPQQSLLSFLSKTKSLSTNEMGHSKLITLGLGSPKHTSSEEAGRWRLWNPEQENPVNPNDDLYWNDILSTASDIYLGAAAGDSDTTTTFSTPSTSKIHEPGATHDSSIAKISDNQLSSASSEGGKYHCQTCNRTLNSKDAYYRHTLSELHFKRHSMSFSNEQLLLIDSSNNKQQSRSKLLEMVRNKSDNTSKTIQNTNSTILKKQCWDFKQCPTCFSQVPSSKFGKHLVSHFHHHKSFNHPFQNQLVLDHIEEIVKEAPFQCKVCTNFYFNWNTDFLQHWVENHSNNQEKKDDENDLLLLNYWCSTCDVRTLSLSDMTEHLRSENHFDIVSMINRSVPITIRKIKLSKCDVCEKTFRLQISLVQHMRSVHLISKFSQTKEKYYKCRYCTYQTYSKRYLKGHIFHVHRETEKYKNSWKCITCCRKFSSKIAAEKHKTSLYHQLQMQKRRNLPNSSQENHSCFICGENVPSFLSDHIIAKHPKETSQCCICGLLFANSQGLSVHMRINRLGCSAVQKHPKMIKEEDGGIPCQFCSFVGISKDLLLLHSTMVVHNSTKKTRSTSEERTNSSSVASECEPFSNQKFELFRQNHHTGLLQCIECQAGPFSSRSKLLKHLMTHNEEQKRCQKCKILHPSISSAQNHICGHSTTTTSDNTSTVRKKQQLFHCPSCTYVCKRATSLKSHSLVHLQKSEITRLKCHQCNKFTCGRMSELRRHIKTKHGDKNDVSSTINNNRNKKNCEKIQCDHCPYASASRQHFARHMELVHAKALCHGSKEGSTNMVYRCRLCPYSTSQMDNLRKHVLKTTKHPGESMYQCLWCEYRCNLQLDFRSHILKFHPQEDAENTINEYFSMKPTTSK